jgi:hypothetical protein
MSHMISYMLDMISDQDILISLKKPYVVQRISRPFVTDNVIADIMAYRDIVACISIRAELWSVQPAVLIR